MNFVIPDFTPASAEIFMAGMILATLLVSTFSGRSGRVVAFFFSMLALLGTATVIIYSRFFIIGLESTVQTFNGLYVSDLLGDFLKLIMLASVAVTFIYGRQYLKVRGIDRPEYYVMVLFMTLGTMILVSASSLVTLYLGLEMMSLSLYALIALNRDRSACTEAAMKYFVLGALASGLLLYGMSMTYGATGSLDLVTIAQSAYTQSANRIVLLFGMVFLLAGVCFKLGVAPFHMWVPDVYQGAPTPVTQLLAGTAKVAAFGMAMRIFVFTLFSYVEQWQLMFMFAAVTSLVIGNLSAIAQNNLKRMLAYSGISHMGFVLLALLSGVVLGDIQNAMPAYSMALFYLVSYVLMSLASFGVILVLSRPDFEAEQLADLKGLNQRSPWLAAMMLIIMFSMAGIPFFIGFFAKFGVLQTLLIGHPYLSLLAILFSVIGAFYYLRVVKTMYFDEPTDTSVISACPAARTLLTINALAIAILGLAPGSLMNMCQQVLKISLNAP